MEIVGTLGEVSVNPISGKGSVTILCDDIRLILAEYEVLKLKKIKAVIKPYRKSRTLSQNAYFWVLCSAVATELRTDAESIHRRYVKDHAFIWTDEDSKPVAIAMLDKVDVSMLPGYWKPYGEKKGNLIQYIRIKGISEMDTNEISIVLDDLIQEAKDLGIQTATPEEVARMKAYGVDI